MHATLTLIPPDFSVNFARCVTQPLGGRVIVAWGGLFHEADFSTCWTFPRNNIEHLVVYLFILTCLGLLFTYRERALTEHVGTCPPGPPVHLPLRVHALQETFSTCEQWQCVADVSFGQCAIERWTSGCTCPSVQDAVMWSHVLIIVVDACTSPPDTRWIVLPVPVSIRVLIR